jgi:potassium efflux system protein
MTQYADAFCEISDANLRNTRDMSLVMKYFTGIFHICRDIRSDMIHLMLATLLFTLSASCFAAEELEAIAPPLPPATIALSDIPSQAASDRAMLDQAASVLAESTIFNQIQQNLFTEKGEITKALPSLTTSLAAASSRDAIFEIKRKWLEFDRQMTNAESTLHARTEVIAQQIVRLKTSLDLWNRTIAQAQTDKAPEDLVKLARIAASDIDKINSSLQKVQNQILELQGKIGRSHRGVQEALDIIKAEEADLLKNLGHRERPPLWGETVSGSGAILYVLINQIGHDLSLWWSAIYAIVSKESARLGLQIFLLIASAIILYRVRKAARNCIAANPSINVGSSVFERPFALAMLLALMLTPWIYTSTSVVLTDAAGLLLIFPVLWIVLPLLNAPIRPVLVFLAIFYVIDWLRDLVAADPFIARIIFIVEMLAAIGLIIWLVRVKALHGSNSRWQKPIRLWLNIALILLAISALAATIGFVRLSVLIGHAVLNSAYLAALLAALIRAADGSIALSLRSHFAQSINLIRRRTDTVRNNIKKLLSIVAIFIWLKVTLDLFALWDYVVAFIKTILFSELNTGTITLSLADIFAFIVTIFTAIFVSRFITTVLDEDVYQRVRLGRGVSFAISAVIRYGIILLGFLLAVSALGIGMDRITILLGALGVGIGFGLQTIVNNFVSGMILIFERPIHIGDSVEVGTVAGIITRIGIRASTIRSFDGADITIPNGTLLSDSVTNWTMSDRIRRIELPVGVAYGTDTDMVIEALYGSLEEQKGILSDPKPQIIFNGFGDSSLDFMLRAWVADNDEFITIRSDIALSMNRALRAYNIEIPFPQRDLHLRSVSPDLKLNKDA